MAIFVCIKQVPDTETKIKISSDKNGIDTSSVKWVMNPYDEFAVEEALLKKAAIGSDKIYALSIGPARVVESLRTALAMGADEAIHIQTDEDFDSFYVASALAAAIKKFGPADMILTGKLSIDGNNSAIGPQIANILGLPHTAVVSKLDIQGEKVIVEREIEAGSKEVVELPKACLITANKGLNTPRFVSLPGIMKAKKKTIHTVNLADLDLAAPTHDVVYKNFELPPEKPQVKMLSADTAAKELVKLLREEAKVI